MGAGCINEKHKPVSICKKHSTNKEEISNLYTKIPDELKKSYFAFQPLP